MMINFKNRKKYMSRCLIIDDNGDFIEVNDLKNLIENF